MSTKLQSQGVHRVTLVGADRQISVDFWQGVLGMPLVFEQPNLDHPEQNHLDFDPAGATHADVLREAHNIRLARGAHNIADEHLADAIGLLSRKPAPDSKKGLELEGDFARV